HMASLAETTVTLEGLRDPRGAQGPGSETHVTTFVASPGPLAFSGLGVGARLTLEVEATDLAPGFAGDAMRVLVACDAAELPAPPLLPAPPPGPVSGRAPAWCMPDADPAHEQTDARSTVSAWVTELPEAAA